jgi:hypothetical protein
MTTLRTPKAVWAALAAGALSIAGPAVLACLGAAPATAGPGCGPGEVDTGKGNNDFSVCAPGASTNTASACEPGFYPTDTAGVCSSMPPNMRPAHVPIADLPLPVQQIIVGGNAAANAPWLQTPPDSDGDGWDDTVDLYPHDSRWR